MLRISLCMTELTSPPQFAFPQTTTEPSSLMAANAESVAAIFARAGCRLPRRGAQMSPRGPQRLLVLGSEIGGRWNETAQRLVRDLVRIRAQRAPPALRAAATSAWTRRWWAALAVAVQQAVTSTALGSPGPGNSIPLDFRHAGGKRCVFKKNCHHATRVLQCSESSCRRADMDDAVNKLALSFLLIRTKLRLSSASRTQ